MFSSGCVNRFGLILQRFIKNILNHIYPNSLLKLKLVFSVRFSSYTLNEQGHDLVWELVCDKCHKTKGV